MPASPRCFRLLLPGLLFLSACSSGYRSGADLSARELTHLRELGLLQPGETVYLFDSQGGLGGARVAGNFFTNRRLAAYWLDQDHPDRTSVNFAYYPDIDTLYAIDRSQTLTYASYLEVRRRDGHRFNVYVDADSARTGAFFRQARAQWLRRRRPPRPSRS